MFKSRRADVAALVNDCGATLVYLIGKFTIILEIYCKSCAIF